MEIPPHSHTLTLRLKILHPSLLTSRAPTASRGRGYRGRMDGWRSAPISLSLSLSLSPSAEQPGDADPTLSEGAAHCQAEPGAPTPEDDQGGQGFRRKSVLSSLNSAAAAVAVAGFSMWCVSSLTHSSSSHSQAFSIRAHSSLPGCWLVGFFFCCWLVVLLVFVLFCWFFFFPFEKKLEIFPVGVSGVIPMVTDQA